MGLIFTAATARTINNWQAERRAPHHLQIQRELVSET